TLEALQPKLSQSNMASCLQPCLHGCLVFAAKYLLPEPEGLGYAPEDSLCADRGAGVSYQEQAVEAACNKRKVEQFMLTGRGPSVWDEYNDFPVVVKFNRLPWAGRGLETTVVPFATWLCVEI
ncbi:unnamed protein product, partial [Effrenium voratum]